MRRLVFASALCCLAGLDPSVLGAQSLPTQQLSTFAIRDVRVFDGRRVLPKANVVVRGGVIAAAGPKVSIPKDATVIEGRGLTLLPGLIDAHVHYISPRNLRQALAFGVTTEFDMGSDSALTAAARQREAEGAAGAEADLLAAGTLVTAPGGHGTEYGLKIPTLAMAAQAPSFVADRINEGADYIKIVYDDGRTYKPIPTLSQETLAAVIQAAHRQEKRTIVHIGSSEEASKSIQAGADGLAHLFVDAPAARDFAAEARRKGAFVIPNLVVMEKIVREFDRTDLIKDERLRPYMSPSDTAALRRSFPVRSRVTTRFKYATDTVRALRRAGVPLLAGSDSGITHGPLLLRELELLVEAGLTPQEALTAATFNPARQFGLGDRGEIRPGARADLFLVRGDPTRDIRALRGIEQVWKAGRKVDRAAFAQSLAKEWATDQDLRRAPPPEGSEAGLVSDFDDGTAKAAFGAGWSVSTDKVAGGGSVAEIRTVPGGVRQSPHALRVSGEIRPGFPFGFAGALLSPGAKPYAPANISGKRLTFWAKGDGKKYGVMVSARSYGSLPVTLPFVAAPAWTRYAIPLKDFDGMEGYDVTGIMFASGPALGKFEFLLDDVRIE